MGTDSQDRMDPMKADHGVKGLRKRESHGSRAAASMPDDIREFGEEQQADNKKALTPGKEGDLFKQGVGNPDRPILA